MSEERQIQAAALAGVLDSIESVAGEKGRNLVLRHAGLEQYIGNPPSTEDDAWLPVAHYRSVNRGIRQAFGDKGSRPLLIYAGEELINGSLTGVTTSAFSMAMRLMPGRLRRKAAFKIISSAIVQITGVPPKIEEGKGKFTLHYYNCPYCEGTQSDEPICYYDVGIMKAVAEWGMGKPQKVTEIECAAVGAEACVFEIVEV
jgi:divinyl protochlorophyllide a 8-vinyl-reductase